MRSLWSGVSGLQAHQLAMDVEGNNIANVNTIGFKYSRANFADMLSQTMKIATAPQGDIGGKNDMQVGLGTQVTSTTKIFSQGSTKNTDKNTDMTIQGDGFFIVSPDGGSNYAYTRNGDFNLDKNGTLVDSNGFAAQGWVKQLATGAGGCVDTTNSGYVDSTQPIESLRIEPGLKIPANTTSKVELKANLNSGRTVTSMDCVSQTAGTDGIDYKNASDTLSTLLKFPDAADANGTAFSNMMSATSDNVSGIQNGTGFSIALEDTFTLAAAAPGVNEQSSTTVTLAVALPQDLKAGDTVKMDGIDYVLAADAAVGAMSFDIVSGLQTDVSNTEGVLYNHAFFVYTTGENGNPKSSYSEDTDIVTSKSVELNGGSTDKVYFFKAPADLVKSYEDFLSNSPGGSKGLTVNINNDTGTLVVNNAPTYAQSYDNATKSSFVSSLSFVAAATPSVSGNDEIVLDAEPEAIANGSIVVGDRIKVGNYDYEILGITGTTIEIDTGGMTLDVTDETIQFAKTTNDFATSKLYGFGGGESQVDFNTEYENVYIDPNSMDEVNLTGSVDISTGDIIRIGTDYVKVTAVSGSTVKFEPDLSSTLAGDTVTVIKYGTPDSMGLKHFTNLFRPFEGDFLKNQSINSEEIKTQYFISNEDMGILFNANGEAFNLQSATQSDDPNKIDGEGIRITFSGTAEDGKREITRTVTFRYTDALNDGIASHPKVTGTIDGGVAHQDSYSYITDKDGNVLHDRPVYFKTIEDLRRQMQEIMQDLDSDGVLDNPEVGVAVNDGGKFEIVNGGSGDVKNISMSIAAIEDDNTDNNVLFTEMMGALEGELAAGKSKMTATLNAATHASSIEVYDSLGSKHSVRLEFRKTGAKEWTWRVEVPKPGTLSGATPEGNILRGGTVSFAEDGALKTVNPPTITFSANNGSKGDQIIQLDMGTVGGFDGITSLDKESTTSGISQDGYPSGDLLGIRIDQTGTVMGSFSNGRSLALAQVALAVFTNNSGLSAAGSNLYVQTSNSGEATIGTAGTGGRGSIMSSALEMSNVDLSKSLTELIVVQRGYQANSKTITTSDQMLEALLAIKR
jgi:flagellar hook-basal body protein